MTNEELDNYMKTVNPNFDSHIEKGTIEMNNEYYNLLEEKMARLINQNQKLKKQLKKNKNQLKGIFAQVNDDMLLRNCGAMKIEIDTYKNQQKEFINWLIENESLDDYCNETTFTYIREKYEEIIGDKE